VPDCGAPPAFVFCEPDAFVSGTIFPFSGVLGVLRDGCGSEVRFSVVEAVAVYVVDDEWGRDGDELAVHKYARIAAVCFSDRAFCVGGVFAFCFAESPFVFCEARVVVGVNDGVSALGERDSSEGVAEAEAAIEKQERDERSLQEIRNVKNNFDDSPLLVCWLVARVSRLVRCARPSIIG